MRTTLLLFDILKQFNAGFSFCKTNEYLNDEFKEIYDKDFISYF